MVRAKERLDLALTSSSLALWDWDLRPARVYFNENWAALLGDRAARIDLRRPTRWSRWNHPEDREVFARRDRQRRARA